MKNPPRIKTVRASEIGSFLFCQRAWWYQKQGIIPQNKAELAGGRSFHYAHGRQVIRVRLVQTLGWVMLFMALALGIIGLTLYVLR